VAIKAMRETYKGRKLLVKRGREWGMLETYVNGVIVGTPCGARQEAAERELVGLRAWVDLVDERRLTEPDAFGPHWYIGAP
jgi:hypothetical protein